MIVDNRWATIRVVRFSHTFANELWMLRSVCVSSADVACKSNINSQYHSSLSTYLPNSVLLTISSLTLVALSFFIQSSCKRTFGIRGTELNKLDVLPVILQLCQSTEGNSKWWPSQCLILSFLPLPLDSWWKASYSLYTVTQTPASVSIQPISGSLLACNSSILKLEQHADYDASMMKLSDSDKNRHLQCFYTVGWLIQKGVQPMKFYSGSSQSQTFYFSLVHSN